MFICQTSSVLLANISQNLGLFNACLPADCCVANNNNYLLVYSSCLSVKLILRYRRSMSGCGRVKRQLQFD